MCGWSCVCLAMDPATGVASVAWGAPLEQCVLSLLAAVRQVIPVGLQPFP